MDETQEKEILANSITKAIAYAENGGKLDINKPVAGKTGEMKSIFQFTPDTWKLYSKQVLGNENAPLNADNETYVVREKVKKWIDEGKTASQIASMWNAGEQRPDAYKQNWKGINKKYGVAYDTPAYAKKVLDYSKQFYTEKASNQKPTNIDPSGTALTTQKNPPIPPKIEPIDTMTTKISDVQKERIAPPIINNALNPGMLQKPLSKKELGGKVEGLFRGNVRVKKKKTIVS